MYKFIQLSCKIKLLILRKPHAKEREEKMIPRGSTEEGGGGESKKHISDRTRKNTNIEKSFIAGTLFAPFPYRPSTPIPARWSAGYPCPPDAISM